MGLTAPEAPRVSAIEMRHVGGAQPPVVAAVPMQPYPMAQVMTGTVLQPAPPGAQLPPEDPYQAKILADQNAGHQML